MGASGFVPPNPVLVGVYLFAEGALLLTLSLFMSTRMPVIASGVVGVAVFGAEWLAGVVGTLGTTLNIAALRTVGQVGRFLLPTDGLWHAGSTVLAVPTVGRVLVPHRPDGGSSQLRASRAMSEPRNLGAKRHRERGKAKVEERQVQSLDIPPVLVITIFGAFLVVLLGALIDVLCAALDPRIRL